MEAIASRRAAAGRQAWPLLLMLAAGLVCVVAVGWNGWISDDGYITARYADNLLHGYGPVFNAQERVQGYTHPLWFALVVMATALVEKPILVAVGLGVLLTILTLAIVARTLLASSIDRGHAALLFAGFVFVLSASEAWRSFQTGGLENSLSHCLLALLICELATTSILRPLPVIAYASALILTRPDFAVLIGPLMASAAYRAWRTGCVRHLMPGLALLVAWGLFAIVYYGSLLPNTAVTKLGVYSMAQGISRGVTYVADWTTYEPASAIAAVCLGGATLLTARQAWRTCLLLGVGLYLASVVVAGGDFMRGRMLLPPFFILALLGTLAVQERLADRRLAIARPAIGSLLFVVIYALSPAQNGATLPNGISNERLFYEGQSLAYELEHGHLELGSPRVKAALFGDLREFSRVCGRFAIHENRIGGIAYELGPGIDVIDRLGLTDAYIARLPASYLEPNPRPGHPYRKVPVAYLARRRDIRLFRNWKDAVHARDCGIIKAAESLASSHDLYAIYDVQELGNQRTYTVGSETAGH
jgi:arabinofuranosyltransferase